MTATATALLDAAAGLADACDRIRFQPPIAHVYNPLRYAWAAHAAYLTQFATTPKSNVLLGMNPGPHGMLQTGVPFGEVAAVRDWMGIRAPIAPPPRRHPKRPVTGFDCPRSEVSGRRLWGLFAERFGSARNFFANHFVVNYCPLGFFDAAGRNLTPDKLTRANAARLLSVCDGHLRAVVEILRAKVVIGVGAFAEQRARLALEHAPIRLGRILHPSPASPAANRDWAGTATRQLEALGVW